MKELNLPLDLDGTIIDSTEAILEGFTKAYEFFDRPVPNDETIKSFIGLALDIMFVKLGIDASETTVYVKTYKKHYRTPVYYWNFWHNAVF